MSEGCYDLFLQLLSRVPDSLNLVMVARLHPQNHECNCVLKVRVSNSIIVLWYICTL